MLQFFSLTIFTSYVVVYVGNLSITCLFGFAAWMKRWAVPGYCLDRGASERFKQQQNYQIFTLFSPIYYIFQLKNFTPLNVSRRVHFLVKHIFLPPPHKIETKTSCYIPLWASYSVPERWKSCAFKKAFSSSVGSAVWQTWIQSNVSWVVRFVRNLFVGELHPSALIPNCFQSWMK